MEENNNKSALLKQLKIDRTTGLPLKPVKASKTQLILVALVFTLLGSGTTYYYYQFDYNNLPNNKTHTGNLVANTPENITSKDISSEVLSETHKTAQANLSILNASG